MASKKHRKKLKQIHQRKRLDSERGKPLILSVLEAMANIALRMGLPPEIAFQSYKSTRGASVEAAKHWEQTIKRLRRN